MPTLEEECTDAVGRLRAALIGLYDSVGVDPATPQDVARALRLNSTLSWKISRLIQGADGLEAVPHIPGSTSIEKVIVATEAKGASAAAIEEVRAAIRGFEEMIEINVGDRTTLDLVIDALGTNGSDVLEASRKRAFLGNSGVYGVQTKTNLISCFLIPNADDPSLLDMAMVRGYTGLRRLRSSVRVPILSFRHWKAQRDLLAFSRWQPVEKGAGTPLLPDFSSTDLPEISAEQAGEGINYILEPGPIGNRGAFDCFFGSMLPGGATRYRTERDPTGEFGLIVTVPTEHLVFDLIVHRDLAFALDLESIAYTYFFNRTAREGDLDESSRLPIQCESRRLAGQPPAIATPLVPRYGHMIKNVCNQLGHPWSSFIGARLEMKYPPLGTTIIQRFKLPDPPPG